VTDLPRKLLAESIGTALLLAIVIGSGIMAERLAGGNAAIALLANTLATVGGLYVLIEVFGPVSGAHFNPAVSAAMAWRGELPRAGLLPYVAAQLLGAMLGAWLVHAMFDMTVLQFSSKVRSGAGQWIAEAVATAGLLLVILRAPQGRAAAMVAAYIGAAYWFTASTSFANPAAVFGRMFSDSFAGIAPASAPGFVLAELAGAAIGVALHGALEQRKLPAGHRMSSRRQAIRMRLAENRPEEENARMKIRVATPDDAAAIAAIYAPIVADTVISFELEPPTAAEFAKRIQATLERLPWLVGEDDTGRVNGYVYAGRHKERAAYQWAVDVTVYVRSDARGSGVGRALYTRLFDELIALNYCQAFAGIALPNAGSVGLHESVGFKPLGVYRRVGFKHGAWRDVGWWQRELQMPSVPTAPRVFDASTFR
jgi:L-amino acid N-acyltransferase YncA/glycerol uptake facilitator-like aquaporin